MSPTPDSTFTNPEQRIADLQRQLAEREVELAECKAERDEALEQQTATAEVLQVINSSPGNLAPVFDAMLEKAMRLCEATYGGLQSFDGAVFRLMAHGTEAMPVEPIAPDLGSALERIVRGDKVVHIPDVVDTEAYRSGVPSRLLLTKMGARTALWVAL